MKMRPHFERALQPESTVYRLVLSFRDISKEYKFSRKPDRSDLMSALSAFALAVGKASCQVDTQLWADEDGKPRLIG